MCGINGVIYNKQNNSKEVTNVLYQMNQEIIHRGPDQDGFFTENNQNFSIGIIDLHFKNSLKLNDQPLVTEKFRLTKSIL